MLFLRRFGVAAGCRGSYWTIAAGRMCGRTILSATRSAAALFLGSCRSAAALPKLVGLLSRGPEALGP